MLSKIRAPGRGLGRRWPVGEPDVLTYRDSNREASDLPYRSRAGTHREIAVLVEHSVVGEKHLVIDRAHLAVLQDGGGVGHVPVQGVLPTSWGGGRAVDETDDHRHGAGAGSEAVPGHDAGIDEVVAEDQVLRGVPVDGKLR